MQKSNIWDPTTKQIFSMAEADTDNGCCEDDEYNLSDEPTAKRETFYNAEEASAIQIDIPDVELTGKTPKMFSESNSVSTFKTRGPMVDTKAKASVIFVELPEAKYSSKALIGVKYPN